jgi:hypothetical protein
LGHLGKSIVGSTIMPEPRFTTQGLFVCVAVCITAIVSMTWYIDALSKPLYQKPKTDRSDSSDDGSWIANRKVSTVRDPNDSTTVRARPGGHLPRRVMAPVG